MLYFLSYVISFIIASILLKKFNQKNQRMEEHYDELTPDEQSQLFSRQFLSRYFKTILVFCALGAPLIFITALLLSCS